MKRYERTMQAHPEIEAWLKNRPKNTQKGFAENLMKFSKAMGISPEEWRRLDKFEARDLAWRYIEPLVAKKPSVAVLAMTALKSWYRNLRGEKLPFDSGRGGKHNIRYIHKKASFEKIPSKQEVYQLVDMASSLRDKAILLTLFQSGIRVNALCSLLYGHVKDQLDQDIITLKITRDIDDKLRGTNIPFYYTFINGEAAETLRQYCALKHKDSKPDASLFYTRKSKKPVSQKWVWQIVKMCVARAGFDPKTMWTHSFRKAFRKIVRRADIDDDDKEQLMGHVIRGSREAYFDRRDVELIKEAYERCDFSRAVPESEVAKLRKRLEEANGKRISTEIRVDNLTHKLEALEKQIQKMMAQKG